MNTDSDSEFDVRSITDSDVRHEINNVIHRAEVQAYTSVLRAFIYKANDIDQEKQDLIISLISELKISKDEHNEVLAEIKDDEMIHLVSHRCKVSRFSVASIDQPLSSLSSVESVQDPFVEPAKAASKDPLKISSKQGRLRKMIGVVAAKDLPAEPSEEEFTPYPHIEKDHLVKLLKQLLLNTAFLSPDLSTGKAPNAADVPTLLGSGSFSLLSHDKDKGNEDAKLPPPYMRWPHMKANQVHGLNLREIGGGFPRHRRGPSIRAACYAIAKPSTMVQKMQNIKRVRGHRNAVYCAIFDRSGRYVITGSNDRLVKIWSMETAYSLASCRGHEGDITDLAVSSNNALVVSSSNDCVIRVWRLPDGLPISVLRGHTGAVTAIAFSPRPNVVYQLLS